ncbi:hypothetical protein L596_004002 [Steinernema carpocapsae]|uniref:ETS domain-containing protein n=1 Tax=Steinernema carpocapsae TaxID=34508 RepID=A0A4U8UYH0_STECR|nr:hypothetical protein L596_004002 [Steinernema carpocapsae]
MRGKRSLARRPYRTFLFTSRFSFLSHLGHFLQTFYAIACHQMQRVTQHSPADSTTSTGYESNTSETCENIGTSNRMTYNRPYSCYSNPPPALTPMYGPQTGSTFPYNCVPDIHSRNYGASTTASIMLNNHQAPFPYWSADVRPRFVPNAYGSSYLDNNYAHAGVSSSNSPQQSHQDSVASESESENGSSCSGGPIKLWQFLLELLQNADGVNCIEWTNNNPYEFRFTDRVEVARLWGKRKNKPKMNYEKLARSLRYYYGKDMIEKGQPGEKYVYHFTRNLMTKEFSVQSSSAH